MKIIKHGQIKNKKCGNCKYFKKRENRVIGGRSGFIAGCLCYVIKSIVTKDSICDKWESK